MSRILAGIGLANLLFLAEWQSIFATYRRDLAYLADTTYPLTQAWSTALAVVLLGLALAAGSAALASGRRWLREPTVARLMVAATALIVLATWVSAASPFLSLSVRLTVAVVLLGPTLVALLHPPGRPSLDAMAAALARTVIFFPVCLASVVWSGVRFDLPSPVEPPADAARRAPAPSRVLWVVFDELDPRALDARTTGGPGLDAFDGLRRQSLVAAAAHAPGRWTMDAIPSLLTGRPVSDAVPEGPSRLALRFADGTAGVFDAADTVLGRARQAGRHVGIAGWYHPYCRVFGAVAARCESMALLDAWFAYRRAAYAAEHGVMAMVPRLLLWHRPWSPESVLTGGLTGARTADEQALVIRRREVEYRRIHASGLELVRDPSLSLVFLHYPVPHLPGFYDREHGRFETTGTADYRDNLALADRTLRELREALAAADLDDRTSVLVQSDHALRPEFWTTMSVWTDALQDLTGGDRSPLTPFFLKLAGAERGGEYAQPFSTVLAHDLVLALLEGSLASTADVAAWLDANRQRLPLTWSVRTPL